MNEQFDDLVRGQLEMLTNIPKVPFNEEKVWKKISTQLPDGPGGSIGKYMFFFGVITAVSILWFSYQNKSEIEVNVQKVNSEKGVEHISQQEFLKNILDQDTLKEKTEKKSIPKNTITSKHTQLSKNSKDPTPTTKVIIEPLQATKEVSIEKRLPASKELKILQNPVIHIYRPSRITGSGLVFKLKANGKIIQKVKNGKRYMIQLNGGMTQFTVGKKTIYVDLKPGEIYYLKVSSKGFPIARSGLGLVTKDEAKKDWE